MLSEFLKEVKERLEKAEFLDKHTADWTDSEFAFVDHAPTDLAKLLAIVEKQRDALERVLPQVYLPHQITHDELIGACNGAVTIIQSALAACERIVEGE